MYRPMKILYFVHFQIIYVQLGFLEFFGYCFALLDHKIKTTESMC